MSNERKMLYMSVIINFVVGVVVGIILFFGQIRSGGAMPENIYDYDTVISAADFFRVAWVNLVWMFTTLAAQGLLRVRFIHPIMIVRGCVTSFTVLYTLYLFGIRESAASIIPQCLASIPLLMFFSAESVFGKNSRESGMSGIVIKKSEAAIMTVLSIASAGAEVIIFRIFCTYLF